MTNKKTDYMEDGQGRLIPIAMIKDVDLLRDQTVSTVMDKVFKIQTVLKNFKKEVWEDIQGFLQLSSEEHGVKFGGEKGNVILTTYDGRYKLQVAINESLQFNEKLQIAKQLIDECIKEWSMDARPELKAIVDSAFAVDKQGHISTTKVLGLRKININDKKWHEAMKAITDSIQITSSKTYLRFYSRLEDGSYNQIPIDIGFLPN